MADFQLHLEQQRRLGLEPVALSSDKQADSAALVENLHLRYPVCYGVDAPDVAARVGAYVNADPPYFQPTAFILRPDGRIALALYSSGKVGRLLAQSAIEFVQGLK